MRRPQRLTQRQEFDAVYRQARPLRGNFLIMRARRSGREFSRFGFTASKAVGNAVKRNRLRRRLREAARSLPVADGWDIVFNSRRGAAAASYAEIREEMQRLLARAQLLREAAAP